MCGICGIVNTDSQREVDEKELRAMTETLRHRGPDEDGIWRRGGAGLGVRRLSIIDIEGGHQPIANEDGTVHVALNGEIYNYRELTRELRARGHRFRTKSDTEVLVHLYEEYGEKMPAKLNGMFAFALWDDEKRRMFLARDRLGQKPLYYRQGGGRFVFASEIKAFAELSDFTPEVEPDAISHYLTFGYVPHPCSILKGVAKLPPAHYATVTNGDVRLCRYWQPVGEPVALDKNEAEERLRELMEDSVRLRLVGEAPLGAFLSGGVDSSIVVGLMAGQGDGRARTFTIGFDEKRYDERRYAQIVARRFGTEHVSEVVRPDVVDIFEKLVWHLDEPLADSSAVPAFVLSHLTRRHMKVALSGDGGDECFLGYPRHTAVWLSGRLDRLSHLAKSFPFAPSLLGHYFRGHANRKEKSGQGPLGRWRHRMPAQEKNLLYRWKRFARVLGEDAVGRFYNWICLFDDESRDGLLTREFRATIRGESGRYRFEKGEYPSRMHSDVGRAAAFDMEYYLPCDLMAKVDRTSMAHGLEVRSPFLDHRVVEFAMNLPDSLKMRRGRGKQILRSAFADILPRPVRRRGKMGFAVPVGPWLREDLREMARDLLTGGVLVQRHIICRSSLETLLSDHLDGRADNGQRLWALLVLEKWVRLFL